MEEIKQIKEINEALIQLKDSIKLVIESIEKLKQLIK